ncbi:MAG: hypothetical protein APF76_18145 [Desulfitibacter sp. BRH_c19]|nr:MAG: hypothetical protein APF76_18145 [Desulfitibacter sp. BRH_c19]
MELSGVYPILATPFDDDGNVDYCSLEILVDFISKSGVQGLTSFLKPSLKCINNHIAKIAQSTSLQIIVQYAPNESGIILDSSFFIELNNQWTNIRHIKVKSVPSGPLISQITQ